MDSSPNTNLTPDEIPSCNVPLSSPLGTSTFKDISLSEGFSLYKNLSNCGSKTVLLYNTATNESIELKSYCDNRSCLNPECQKHRLYQYMRKHASQISKLNANMRKPKAWVFTDKRQSYPIDKNYIKNRTKLLRNLLDKSKHSKYGSTSDYSYHLEIKIEGSQKYPNTWYPHYHVVSGGMTDLRFMRKLWGSQIKYEDALNPDDLAFYVSKYASKVPRADSLEHYLQYARAVYKLKMHEFSTRGEKPPPSEWTIIISQKPSSTIITFLEMQKFFSDYANRYGFGG
jgi:hypothetical protein